MVFGAATRHSSARLVRAGFQGRAGGDLLSVIHKGTSFCFFLLLFVRSQE